MPSHPLAAACSLALELRSAPAPAPSRSESATSSSRVICPRWTGHLYLTQKRNI